MVGFRGCFSHLRNGVSFSYADLTDESEGQNISDLLLCRRRLATTHCCRSRTTVRAPAVPTDIEASWL